MFSSATHVQGEMITPDTCIACEYGEHVDIWSFLSYAEPIDLARVMTYEITTEEDIIDYTFENERTQKFAEFIRTVPVDERDLRHDYYELSKGY